MRLIDNWSIILNLLKTTELEARQRTERSSHGFFISAMLSSIGLIYMHETGGRGQMCKSDGR